MDVSRLLNRPVPLGLCLGLPGGVRHGWDRCSMMNSLAITDTQRLAEDARRGLRMVAAGEDQTMDGWLIYGQALNEGRKKFPSDNKLHEWKVVWELTTPDRHDEAAALWSAKHPEAFIATRLQHPKVRTLQGLWRKWNAEKRPQPTPKPTFEEPTEADLRRMDMLRNTINHPSTETHLRANAQAKLNDYLERLITKPIILPAAGQ